MLDIDVVSAKASGGHQEDQRLTNYRRHVESQNLLGDLRVLCGGLGVMTLFVLALVAILEGTEGGLLAGGVLGILVRFGKFGFFLACLWGLFEPWTDYSDKNAGECKQRKEMLARMEQDPDYWRKHDENQIERDKERKELEEMLVRRGHDPDWLEKRCRESATAIEALTRKLQTLPKASPTGDKTPPRR
jgi:hypothetical protein